MTESYERDVKITHTIKDCYKHYRVKCMENGIKHLSLNKYKEVCYLFNIKLSDAIIKQSFEYKLPFKLGILRIKKNKQKFKIVDGRLKPKKKMIDWYQTRYVLWKRLYPDKTLAELKGIRDKPLVMFTNEHSNGEIMRWYWDKKYMRIKNCRYYLFRPVKKNRLDLAKHIKDEDRENDYSF
jgi:hypothetical protein